MPQPYTTTHRHCMAEAGDQELQRWIPRQFPAGRPPETPDRGTNGRCVSADWIRPEQLNVSEDIRPDSQESDPSAFSSPT